MYELALFAGAGGGILGGILRGHAIVGAVEIEAYPRKVLLQRQRDGILPEFPIWDDVTTFRIDNPDCRDYIEKLREVRDELVISGGFPCQDISSSNPNAEGLKGERSGLWFEFSRIIGEIRPRYAFIENSPMLTIRGGTRVVADLAEMGYNCRWGVIGADAIGLDHRRARMWMVANSGDFGVSGHNEQSKVIGQAIQGRAGSPLSWEILDGAQFDGRQYEDMPKPCLAGVENDVADRVDRLKAIGNGQVPAVVDLAWEILGQ